MSRFTQWISNFRVVAPALPVLIDFNDRKPQRRWVYFFCLFYCGLSAGVYGYDLQTAETLFLQNNYGVKAAETQVQIKNTFENQHYSVLLPKVDLTTAFQKHTPTEYTLEVRFTIPYPPVWAAEKKILENETAIATQEQSQTRKVAVVQFRKLYFEIKHLEKNLRSYQESLRWSQQFVAESEARFAKGFVSDADVARARLQLLETEQGVSSLKEAITSRKAELATRLGGGTKGEELTLQTEFIPSQRVLEMNPSELRNLIQPGVSDEVLVQQLRAENTRLGDRAKWYKYLPKLSLGAQVPVSDSDRQNVYLASLSWNLFDGGADWFEDRRRSYGEDLARQQFEGASQEFQIHRQALVERFWDARAKYVSQRKALEISEKIVANSRSRFHGGMMSAREMSQDMQSHLRHVTSLNDLALLLVTLSLDVSLFDNEGLYQSLVLGMK